MSEQNKLPVLPTKVNAAIAFQSLSITSDGTIAGTKIVINGEEVNPETFCFNMWNHEYNRSVRFDWSAMDKDQKAGDISERNYYSYIPVQASQQVHTLAGQLFMTDATNVNPSVVVKSNRYSEIGIAKQS